MMYLYGSVFYGIYFYVSFPMFFQYAFRLSNNRLDEEKGQNWTLSYTAMHSLAGCMIVTIFLDLWRLSIGALPGVGHTDSLPHLLQ